MMISKNIRAHREALGLTQAELGKRVGLGPRFAQQRISAWETGGNRTPGAKYLVALAKALRCSLDELVLG